MERRERGRDETLAGGGREGACKEWDERGEKERWEAVRRRERGEAMGNGWCTCIERKRREGKGLVLSEGERGRDGARAERGGEG